MLECIPSGVLHDLIYTRGPLDAGMARFYYANIVCALDFLHANGIVHRDLKPANILIKSDGYIALVDFGLSKPETDAHKWALVGTPIYMAPELHCSQSGIGRGVDWFASGVILYEMITKRAVSVSSHIHCRYVNIFAAVLWERRGTDIPSNRFQEVQVAERYPCWEITQVNGGGSSHPQSVRPTGGCGASH
jgi:serine/threonine protein kinase